MNCQEMTTLLHGYFDGELDLLRSLETERHFKECAACLRRYQDLAVFRWQCVEGPVQQLLVGPLQQGGVRRGRGRDSVVDLVIEGRLQLCPPLLPEPIIKAVTHDAQQPGTAVASPEPAEELERAQV